MMKIMLLSLIGRNIDPSDQHYPRTSAQSLLLCLLEVLSRSESVCPGPVEFIPSGRNLEVELRAWSGDPRDSRLGSQRYKRMPRLSSVVKLCDAGLEDNSFQRYECLVCS